MVQSPPEPEKIPLVQAPACGTAAANSSPVPLAGTAAANFRPCPARGDSGREFPPLSRLRERGRGRGETEEGNVRFSGRGQATASADDSFAVQQSRDLSARADQQRLGCLRSAALRGDRDTGTDGGRRGTVDSGRLRQERQ